MKLAEKIRPLGFWALDSLKGRQVERHYREVGFLMNHAQPDEIVQRQEQYLSGLLKHAVSECPYYSEYKRFKNLSDFPVVNKNLIKNSEKLFIAKGYEIQNLLRVTTSGSTGTPFRTYQNKEKKFRNYADTLCFAEHAGFRMGHRLIYLKIWVQEKMQGRLNYWLQNIVPVDVIHLNDREIDNLLKRLSKNSSTYGFLGYASALELICKYLDRKNADPIKARVKSAIAMSETLNVYTKTTFKKYFDVTLVSRYSNLENGILAQQEINGKSRFLVNSSSYQIEILKMDSDEPAKEGELGRIVVTDLFNYAMPMIRYDTGDVGAMETDSKNPGKKYLVKLEGRKLDLLYDTQGELVSSYIVYKNMWQYTEIDQYQLIQEGAKKYRFKINTQSEFTREKQLVDEFKTFLGKDSDFRIEYVSEIPLLASGKRKKIVNNYKN